VSGDEFALVVACETDWVWDLDAVVTAVAENWPQTAVHDGYPVPGSTYRAVLDIPETGGRGIQAALDDSGKMVSLSYGSPGVTAEFVTWLLRRFPPPGDVTVQLFEWGDHPRVTPQTTVQELLATGP
jgi:hypothetical protein